MIMRLNFMNVLETNHIYVFHQRRRRELCQSFSKVLV
eukprot:UN12849